MRISDWSSDVCSSDLNLKQRVASHSAGRDAAAGKPASIPAADLNHEGPRVLQHAIFRLQRPALIEMVIHALGIEEVLNPVARQNEADVAHDFAGGIVDADGVDLGEDHADDVRSEERRVGKEGCSTCRTRWSPET